MSKKAPFVAGNWKMHATLAEARALVSAIVAAAPGVGNARMVVIPPFTALSEAAKLTAGTAVGLGGQNLHWEDKGAFTGEVSGPMLKDAGCAYVVIGHSERRQFFGETDATVNQRVRAALRHGLSPILCAGESLDRIGIQLDEGLREIVSDDAARIVFAYEPVWAIGTGRTATPAQAEEVHAFIRGRLEEKYGKKAAACAIILYGGSVKPANAYTLYLEKDIDGFLVGGASLEVDLFVRIASEALRASKEE
jgi:triosephosphate isomerase